jgi:hypothetical protein
MNPLDPVVQGENTIARRATYKKPPVIERAATVTAHIPPEVFFARFESWKSEILKDFPDYDPIQQWLINYTNREEVPVLDEVPPQVRVTHRFWKRNLQNQRFMSMRVLPNRLTLNLHPEYNDPHRYEELRDALMRWFPLWVAHFSATEFPQVHLDYINLLAAETTPQFVEPKTGAVHIGQALTVFASGPGKNQGITPPYDCQMGLAIDRERGSFFRLRILGLDSRPNRGAAVRIDFQAVTDRHDSPLTASEIRGEVEFLHEVMIEKFEAVFTDAAKISFQSV